MRVLAIAALALSIIACNSEQKTEGGAAPGVSAAATKPGADAKPATKAEAKGELTKLPKLGLIVELPTGSTVTDSIGGEGHMIMSLTGPFNVTVAGPDKPKTPDAAKKDAEMFNPKNVKTETLPDGWVLMFENEGSAGTNYWLTVRREIGGKAYICDTSVANEAQRTAALAACKSLKQ
jgi:hypothetical protein